MLRTRLGLVALCLAVGLVAAFPSTVGAFTATPAAQAVIAKVRATVRKLKAIRVVTTGAVVYCPQGAEGWTYAPAPGCRIPVRVTEEYDLSNGHVYRIIGHVTAAHLPAFRYVVDASGWYRSVPGEDCWTLELSGFVPALFIDYPLPGERVSIASRAARRIVLRDVAAGGAYTQLEDVNPKTFFEFRDVQITRPDHKSYRVYFQSTELRAQSHRPDTPTVCQLGHGYRN